MRLTPIGFLVGSLVTFVACTAPDYKFADVQADAGPVVQGKDSGGSSGKDTGPSDDDDGGADSGVDAGVLPFDGATMASTADPNADCTGFSVPAGGVNSKLLAEDGGQSVCVMFFHNNPWHRGWSDANALCQKITRVRTTGRLATAVSKSKGTAINNGFTLGLSTWIGLTADPAGSPTSKDSWRWVTGADTSLFDGWLTGHPQVITDFCAQWAGAASPSWVEADCAKQTGILCEIDFPL